MKLTKAVVTIGCAVVLSCAAMLIGPSPASATAVLYLSDGVTSITVADGSLNDSCGAANCVTYNGALGANWIVNVSTGLSHIPTPNSIDLNSVNVGTGHLTIKFGDTDFTGSTNFSVISAIGGTAGGTITWNSGVNTSNIDPITNGTDQTGPTHGPAGPGAFSATLGDPYTATGPFALMLQVDIFHNQLAVTSFDYEGKVPEPASLLLLGVGLLATARLRRRAA